ncbi:hypothetical protein IWX91DRAFT_342326 [Phyllosticta citricarpa]
MTRKDGIFLHLNIFGNALYQYSHRHFISLFVGQILWLVFAFFLRGFFRLSCLLIFWVISGHNHQSEESWQIILMGISLSAYMFGRIVFVSPSPWLIALGVGVC